MIEQIFAFAISLLLALIAIPWLSAFARRVSLVDTPDATRKLHGQSIPLVGGIAVFIATFGGLSILFLARFSIVPDWSAWSSTFEFGSYQLKQYIGLFLACSAILVVGILDDRFQIRGRQKLLGQFLACTILVLCDYTFSRVDVLGYSFKFGSFSFIVAYLWLLGAINSINLLDGADGFAGAIGFIMGAAFCVMALVTSDPIDAAIAAAAAGALLGFLRSNIPPAKIFLGDAGSMLIGLLFAALAIRCTFKQATAYAFFGPVALLAIPFFDTGAAILRRRLTGRSIYVVDRAHLHHAFENRGYSPRRSLIMVTMLSLVTAVGGTASVILQQSEIALFCMLLVIGFLMANRIFGVVEFKLVLSRIQSLLKSFTVIHDRNNIGHHHASFQLQGDRDWEAVWETLRDFASKHNFKVMKLDLHLPWLQESFHATYKRSKVTRILGEEFGFAVPLHVEGRFVGRIDVIANEAEDMTPYEVIDDTTDTLRDLEQQFNEVVNSIDHASHLPITSGEHSAEETIDQADQDQTVRQLAPHIGEAEKHIPTEEDETGTKATFPR